MALNRAIKEALKFTQTKLSDQTKIDKAAIF